MKRCWVMLQRVDEGEASVFCGDGGEADVEADGEAVVACGRGGCRALLLLLFWSGDAK